MLNTQQREIEKAPAGIFLLYEGLPPTIIESQVIGHVQRMKEVGVEIEIWAFAVTSQAFASGKAALVSLRRAYPELVIRLFRGFKPALPFSETFNAALLIWHMWRLGEHPVFVRARTEHATMIASIAKRIMNYQLIWDARGDTASEFTETSRDFPWYLRCLAPLKMRAIKKRIKMSQRQSDYAIFVSEALRDLQIGAMPIDRTMILPCLADESLFYFDPNLRERSRNELGYSDNDIVIIYVGSTSIWQCVPEMVALMEQAMRTHRACKVLIVTPSHERFQRLFSREYQDRITITTGRLSDMNRFLNAADLGTLLRKANAINWVASPVKYGEYSLAGLPVITTEAIDQINRLGRYIGNIMTECDLTDEGLEARMKKWDRSIVAMKAKESLGSKSHVDEVHKLYLGCSH